MIVRTAKPQTGPTAVFLKGLYAGLSATSAFPSSVSRARRTTALRIKAFQRAGLSTVDDIDTAEFGKLALIALLADPRVERRLRHEKTGKAALPLIAPLPQRRPVDEPLTILVPARDEETRHRDDRRDAAADVSRTPR